MADRIAEIREQLDEYQKAALFGTGPTGLKYHAPVIIKDLLAHIDKLERALEVAKNLIFRMETDLSIEEHLTPREMLSEECRAARVEIKEIMNE